MKKLLAILILASTFSTNSYANDDHPNVPLMKAMELGMMAMALAGTHYHSSDEKPNLVQDTMNNVFLPFMKTDEELDYFSKAYINWSKKIEEENPVNMECEKFLENMTESK